MAKKIGVKSEDAPEYGALGARPFTRAEAAILRQAAEIIEKKRLLMDGSQAMGEPSTVGKWLQLQLAARPHESFVALYLDNQNKLIEWREEFSGTVDGANVYPRVIVKRALEINAAALIFGHNHPSGNRDPSSADIRITERLKAALMLVDIRVLDHFIVSIAGVTSFADRGLI